MWELDYKENWVLRNWCFWTVVLEKTAGESNQSILKEISPEYSLGLMLRLKLQYFGHLMQKNWLIGKDPDSGKDWWQEEEKTTEDGMVGWHHRLHGYKFEQVLWAGEGQGSLVCCSLWGHKKSQTWLSHWTELKLVGDGGYWDTPDVHNIER